MFQPGGFHRGNAAHERIWKTDEGKAVFTPQKQLNALSYGKTDGRFRPVTMRHKDQFSTTIYGYSDRFPGIEGTRDVLLMCEDAIRTAGLRAGQVVTLLSDLEDAIRYQLPKLVVTAHNLPRGTIDEYYPEAHVLNAIDQHDELSKTPA